MKGEIYVIAAVRSGDKLVPAYCSLKGDVEWVRMNISDPVPTGTPEYFIEVGMSVEGAGATIDKNSFRTATHANFDMDVPKLRQEHALLKSGLRAILESDEELAKARSTDAFHKAMRD